MERDSEYSTARRHVHALRSLYQHAAIFALVNLTLLTVDLLTPGGPWFQWVLLGWGISLALHAVNVVAGHELFGEEWERRKVREYVTRHHVGGT